MSTLRVSIKTVKSHGTWKLLPAEAEEQMQSLQTAEVSIDYTPDTYTSSIFTSRAACSHGHPRATGDCMSLALHGVLACFGGSTDTVCLFICPTQSSSSAHHGQLPSWHYFILAGTPSLPEIPKVARLLPSLTNFVHQQLISVVLRKGMGW